MRMAMARNVVSALAAVLLGGALALAQGPGGGMGQGPMMMQHRPPFEGAFGAASNHGRWWNNPRMIEQLKLTDDQRKAMDQILYDHRAKLIDLQANLERAELDMEPLMSADQPDQKAMEAQIDKIVAARADLERANALFLLDIRMKLTLDQWKQLKDMRADRMREERHGPGMHREWRQRPDGQGGPPPAATPQAPGSNPPAQGSGSGDEQ